MFVNPYKTMSDKELADIYADIKNSKQNGVRAESLVPYATEIKNNINGPANTFTLSEGLRMAEKHFYTEVCERFCAQFGGDK